MRSPSVAALAAAQDLAANFCTQTGALLGGLCAPVCTSRVSTPPHSMLRRQTATTERAGALGNAPTLVRSKRILQNT